MSTQYWVIGGEFRDTHFSAMVEGSAQAFGPFRSYEDAKAKWREQSLNSRHKAHMRFTIATEAAPTKQRAPAMQPAVVSSAAA